MEPKTLAELRLRTQHRPTGFTRHYYGFADGSRVEVPLPVSLRIVQYDEVFPQTREQRCWFHKVANVLGALPKSAQPGAKKALTEIWNAEDKDHALAAVVRAGGRFVNGQLVERFDEHAVA